MKPKTIMWLVIGLVVLVAVVAGFSSSGGGGIEDVDAAGAQKALDAGAQAVDVRTAGEFQMGHISGAVNAPVDGLAQAIQSWDRDATYVVYCATGSRSIAAVQTMREAGFVNIKHLAAGLQAWNGGLDQGAASTGKIDTGGKPLMIEFFTDS